MWWCRADIVQRRALIVSGSLAAAAVLTGCGFHLRNNQSMAFQTVAILPERGSGVALDLSRYFGEALRPAAPSAGQEAPQVLVEILQEQREKTVVGQSAAGQVREFQLRVRVTLRVRTPQGRELIPATEITQQRDFSFSENAALAKEAEEAALYRDMQTDIVQQILRRLGAIKTLG
jgi:LPS-assembly lipoprotein